MEEYPIDTIAQGAVESVFTTHVTHQEQFYVHIESRSKILEDIMQNLEKLYAGREDEHNLLTHHKIGALCAACFTDDCNWYRGKITGLMSNGLIEVQFVDYGNTDYVSADRLRVLVPELVQYPVQAYRCALAGVSASKGFWPPELMVQFEDIVIDKRCKAVFLGKKEEEEVYYVEMTDGSGRNLNKMFGAQNVMAPPTKTMQKSGGPVSAFKPTEWKTGDRIQATVVYVKDPGMFWCQELRYANEIIVLSEELSRLHMTQEILPLSSVTSGTVCAAKFSEDEAWYRGVVQSVKGKEARVYFVDYGNTESVDLTSICTLKPEMRALPALAVKCCLSSVDSRADWTEEVVEEFEKLVVDREFEVFVKGKADNNTYLISLLDIEENKDVGTLLQPAIDRAGPPQRSAQPVQTVSTAGANAQANRNNSSASGADNRQGLPVGASAEVFLTWVTSPGDFWVQRTDSNEILQRLTKELQEIYSQDQPLAMSHRRAFVVARFSEDQQWYRALVLKEFEDKVKVLFIDFGNSDTIDKSELRQVTPHLGLIHPLAFRCSLAGVRPLKNTTTWSVDATDFLERMTENGCLCHVIEETKDHRLVKLTAGGKDVASELIALAVVSDSSDAGRVTKSAGPSYPEPMKLKQGHMERVIVAYVDSPTSFWCQVNSEAVKLDKVMEQLESHYSDEGGTPLPHPSVGLACVAKYSEDNAWYRARVVGMSGHGLEVHFVDFGNQEIVAPQFVCIPEPRFLDLAPQAKKCSLDLKGDASALKETFEDLVMDKELDMTVIGQRGDVTVVELLVDGQPITPDLKAALCNAPLRLKPANKLTGGTVVQAFTSYVASPGKFFLQLSGVDAELQNLMDSISVQYVSGSGPALSNPSVGQSCVALYNEDNLWYRGTITAVQGDNLSVLFVDYGNEELINKSSVRALTSDIADVPIMAYQCRLDGVTSGSGWSEAAISAFEALVMDQELSVTFVTDKSVKLTCAGKDIASQLIQAGHGQSVGGQSTQLSSPKPAGDSGWGETGATSPGSSFGSSRSFGGGREESSSGPRNAEGRFGGRSGGGDGGFRGERKDRSFGKEDNSSGGFGGGRREGGGRFGGAKSEDSGFGGGRREGGGSFGGGRRDEGRDGGGGRRREGDSGRFGQQRDEEGFGGGRRERKTSTGSSGSGGGEANTFTYPSPPSEPESAILVHMDDDGTFYLQLPSMEKDILFLSKRLAGSYKEGRGPRLKDRAAKGTVCCGKFPDDGNMYRCLVEDVQGSNIFVRYVDYGNTAQCSPYDLKLLFPDLLQYPVQAFPCHLRGLNWSLDLADKFGSATLDKDLQVTFTSTELPFQVDIMTPDGDLLALLQGKSAPPAPKISPAPGAKPPSRFGTSTPTKGFGSSSPKSTGFGSTSPKESGFGSTSPKSSGFGSTARSLNLNQSPVSQPQVSIPKQEYVAQSAPTGQLTAYISHLNPDGYFYLQLDKDSAVLESLSDRMATLASDSKHPSVATGTACAAIFSEDSCWYRAIVDSQSGGKLNLIFVDYGNGDTVDQSTIKPLNSELLAIPPMAYKVTFQGCGPLQTAGQSILANYLIEHQLTVTFLSQQTPYEVSLITSEGEDLQDIVCPPTELRDGSVPSDVTPVSVSHIEDDGRFFVQLYKESPALQAMQEAMQTFYKSQDKTEDFVCEVGKACVVELEDGSFVRGKVVSVADDAIDVKTVDYGYIKRVSSDKLKPLDVQFMKARSHALECRLKGVNAWTDELREKFEEMIGDKVLNATFYTRTDPPYRVSLSRSIELDLLGLKAPILESPERPSPQKQATEPGEKAVSAKSTPGEESVIVHVEDDGSFYLQLCSEEDALQNVSDLLQEPSQGEQALEPNVGDFVCAQFTEDDMWYRACVEQQVEGEGEEKQYLVRFVDYGNTDTVGQGRLAPLPEGTQLSDKPAFAKKCQLSSGVELSPDQLEQFRTLVTDQVVKATFKSEVENGVSQVSAVLNGHAIEQTLGLGGQAESQTVKYETDIEEEFTDAVEVLEQGELSAEAVLNVNNNLVTKSDLNTAQGDFGQTSSFSVGERISITVSYAASPDCFYFQVDKNCQGLDAMMDELYQELSATEASENAPKVEVGQMYAAQYGETDKDDTWYRVRVKAINEDGTYQIFYVDHGNEETVQATSLHSLPERFLSQPSWCTKGQLAGVTPLGEGWTEEAVEEFRALVEEKALLADIVSLPGSDSSCKVHLLDMGIPVDQELIKKGFASASCDEGTLVSSSVQQVFLDTTLEQSKLTDPDVLESTHLEGDTAAHGSKSVDESNTDAVEEESGSQPKQECLPVTELRCVSNSLKELESISVYVSDSESPSLFWCQLASNIDSTLEELRSALENYATPERRLEADSLKSGQLVVGLYLEHDQMYRARAKIVSTDVPDDHDSVTVRFVDFGIQSDVPKQEIYHIEESLLQWPAQAFACCLDKVRPSDEHWSTQASQRFSELTKDNELTLKLVGRTSDGTALVELTLGESGKSVAETLLEENLAVPTHQEGGNDTSRPDAAAKGVNMSEILEITQPIMESTAAVADHTQNVQSLSFETVLDGPFKYLNLSLHTEYDVVVSNDELPNAFAVQLNELSSQYHDLVSEIAIHIASADRSEFKPNTGDACLVENDGAWYRAVVLSHEGGEYKVRSVDCGWELTGVTQILSIPSNLLEVPAQSVSCYLAGVVSVEPEWCPDAITFFIDYLKGNQLCMYILETAEDGKYGVYLSDLDNTMSQSLNRALVDLGYAEVVPGSNIEVQIEMEKTLDTEDMSHLEASFNEVTEGRNNAYGDSSAEDEPENDVSSDPPSFHEDNEETIGSDESQKESVETTLEKNEEAQDIQVLDNEKIEVNGVEEGEDFTESEA